MVGVDTEFIKMLLISALVGGLLGVERELKVQVIAGTRTFMLISITGTLSVYLAAKVATPWVMNLTLLGVVFLVLLLGIIKNFRTFDVGITTPVAFFLAYLIGILVGLGLYIEAISASILITSILVFKKYTTILTEALGHEEMRSAMEFGLIAFVLYPVMPDYPIDPLGLINPKMLVLAVIVVSTIGFAGFLTLRLVGLELALTLVGGIGGLVNSQATISALSEKVRKSAEIAPNALRGMILANAVMLARNLALASFLSIELLRFLLLPTLAMCLLGAAQSFLIKTKKSLREVELPLESPFAILPSIKFALIFGVITIVSHYAQSLGAGGVYITALAGGWVSSAAVVASLASLVSMGKLEVEVAALGGVLAMIASSISGAFIARMSGTSELAGRYLRVVLLNISAGIGVAVLILLR
ncbi:MgtC/SapB family protein [Candidatus Pyrohabitans sp.]